MCNVLTWIRRDWSRDWSGSCARHLVLWSWTLNGLLIGHLVVAQTAQSANELEVFLAAKAVAGHGQPSPREDDDWGDADVILGLTRAQLRVFGEYFIAPKDHELERFQIGYEVVPDTVVWLGRFQQPASNWNSEHDRGRYLQTAITRPTIENWEIEDGLIPQHITGLLLESRRPLGDSAGVLLAASAGADPTLDSDHNVPVNLVGANPGRHGVSLKGRLAFLSDYAGTSSAGILFGHDQLFASSQVASGPLQSSHVALTTYGAFVDYGRGAWRLIGSVYYFDIGLDPPNRNEGITSGYLQVERQIPHDLTVFARIEDSARMRSSVYVRLLDESSADLDMAIRRQTGGLRWDFARRQALTVELGHEASILQHGGEVRIQWSAAVR